MIVDRILQIIEYKKLNKRKFYIETGLSNGFLDKVKDIGSSKIEQILNNYPDINPEWLLTGNGSMLKDIEIYNIGIDTIAEKLLYFKIQNGLTHYDLVGNLKITPLKMKELIDTNQVTEEHINAISEKFRISNEWFLTGKGEMPKIKKEKMERFSEPPSIKEDNKTSILETENKLLKETIVSFKETNISLKETNELLKDKIKSLETEIESLKNKR